MNPIAAAVALFFVILLVTFVIVLAAYLVFSYSKKGRVDSMYIFYREITQQAKLELAAGGAGCSGPSRLYRMNFPWVGDINRVAAECAEKIKTGAVDSEEYKKLGVRLENILNALSSCKRAVPKGDIKGYNRINLGVTFAEMYSPYHPTKEEKERLATEDEIMYAAEFSDEKKEYITRQEYDEIKTMLSECGDFLNVLVYEVDYGWKLWPFMKDKLQSTVLCFDNQIVDINSDDGVACLLGAGVEYYAYFEIPSGYPEMDKVIYYSLKILLWKKMMAQLLSEQFNIVDTILNYEPGYARERGIKTLEQPITKVVKK